VGESGQLDQETQYWVALKDDVGMVAACHAVGITRKPVAGREWRVPPVRLAEVARTGRYLSLLERQRIATNPPQRAQTGR
jgi:transposase, IS30 family